HILGTNNTSTDDTSSCEPTPPTAEWLTIDSIILTWIFTTLSKTLQQRLVVENPTTNKEAWDILALIFNDNKRSRSIALKAELRSIKLGDLSIDAYFRKIESIATILSSLGSSVSNDDVVNIVLDELPEKYQHVSDIIIHQDPYPDLKTVRYMLTTTEMRLKSRTNSTYFDVPRSTVASSSNLSNTDMQTLQSILAKLKINGSMVKRQNNNNSGVSNSTSPMALYASPHGSGPMYSTFNNPPGFNPLPQDQSVQYTPAQSATYSYYPAQIYTQPNISPPGAGQQVYQPGQTGSDLYPVMKYSTIPQAFLTSQYAWHQRLGHPGSEVLRRVLSSNSLLCNKELPPVLCHACQLGKHMKLSFVSSTTSVQSCFDIVHSDLWTSPIPSLSDTTHKLKPRATPSIYLGHATNHRGYRCLNLNTNKIIISRHVTFDETVFSFGSMTPTSSPSYDFLDDSSNVIPNFIRSSPITNPDTLVILTILPNIPPATPSIPQIGSPFPTVRNDEPNSLGQTSSPTEPLQTASPSEPITQVSPDPTATSSSALQPNATQQPASVFVSQIPSAPDTNSNPASIHPMVTRFRVRTNHPTKCLNLHVSSISPLPKSYNDAFNDPNWQNAMFVEYNALIKNDTWTLVPQPTDANIVRCMLLFRYKYLADGTLSRYKAHLLANGSTHIEGINVDETYSPVVKLGTIQTPPGFRDHARPDYRKYAVEILERAHMVSCNPSQTPVDTESKLGDDVQQVCLYTHDPREPHFSALKRILRYVCGFLDYGLQLFSSSNTSLVTYSDSDWAGFPTRRSTSRYYVFLGNNLLSWSSKLQPTLSRSNAEAEYRGVANDVAETCWLRNLLRELHTPLSSAMLVNCDNVSVVYLSFNPVTHQRTKHIEIDIHFVQDLVATGQVRVLYVPSCSQYADISTKGLPTALFKEFHTSLCV
nr:ribonuclease H-like domain-containing protein [Tanacetum cinerariifolium]